MTHFANTTVVQGAVTGWPVAGPVTTYFGVKDDLHPAGHSGDDIAANAGTAIYAPAPATVCDVFIMPLNGNQWDSFKAIFGNCVILDHGDSYTLYAHMRDAPLVHEGQTITAGTQLGVVGSTGFSTGPHLHWGMSKHDNRYLNFPPAAGPVGVLLDPFTYAESPPAAVPDVAAAMRHLDTAEAEIKAARVALGG